MMFVAFKAFVIVSGYKRPPCVWLSILMAVQVIWDLTEALA